jgi:hypothetical protein
MASWTAVLKCMHGDEEALHTATFAFPNDVREPQVRSRIENVRRSDELVDLKREGCRDTMLAKAQAALLVKKGDEDAA